MAQQGRPITAFMGILSLPLLLGNEYYQDFFISIPSSVRLRDLFRISQTSVTTRTRAALGDDARELDELQQLRTLTSETPVAESLCNWYLVTTLICACLH